MSRRAVTLQHRGVYLPPVDNWRYRDLLANPPTDEDAAEALAPIRQLAARLDEHSPAPIPRMEEAFARLRARYLALPDAQRRRLEGDRARIAMHEAGHAVVDEAEGISMGYIEISPQRGYHRGGTLGFIQGSFVWPCPDTAPAMLRCMARTKLGGWGGDALYLGDAELAGTACPPEMHWAEELVAVAALKLARPGQPEWFTLLEWFRLHAPLYREQQQRVLATLQRWAAVHLELAERLVRSNTRQVAGRTYDRLVRPIREAVPRRPLGRDIL